MEYAPLMLFIWIVGWIIACGAHQEACEKTKSHGSVAGYLFLLLTWPHYLGYSFSGRG